MLGLIQDSLLILRAVKDVKNFDGLPHLAVIHKVLSRREASHAGSNIAAGAPAAWIFGNDPEALCYRVDQMAGNLHASPFCLINEDLIQIALGVF